MPLAPDPMVVASIRALGNSDSGGAWGVVVIGGDGAGSSSGDRLITIMSPNYEKGNSQVLI